MGTFYVYIMFLCMSALKVSLPSYCFTHFLSPLLILIDLCTEESQDYFSILLCAYKLQSQRERKKSVVIFFSVLNDNRGQAIEGHIFRFKGE